jgi:intracellular multiplication protein IcmJ
MTDHVLNPSPHAALGANFAQRALAPLGFATKATVWDSASSAAALRTEAVIQSGSRCMFCGLTSAANELHHLNDNHQDESPGNLSTADAICHRWRHLSEVGAGQGLLVYLPQLAPRDVSHLLRTVTVGLNSHYPNTQTEAKTLLNWLASHSEYVDNAWGTSEPTAFGAAIQRLSHECSGSNGWVPEIVFEGLALIINPAALTQPAAVWAAELSPQQQPAEWPQIYHSVMHAPS